MPAKPPAPPPARIIYDREGTFTIGERSYRPHVEHPISEKLAAEIYAALSHWERKGFRLIGYSPPAGPTE